MKSAVSVCGMFLLLWLLSPKADAASSVIEAPAGQYGVGLRIVQQYDYTRSFRATVDPVTGETVHGELARPMQTLVWYPAKLSAHKVVYADYVRTRATEQQFDVSAAVKSQLAAKGEQALSGHVGTKTRDVLQSPMLASFGAGPALGKFPVVVYAPGAGGAADENADLCEYLASHGYIVVASTSLGTHEKNIAYALEDAQTQARDIEFLVGYALSLPQVDGDRVAVIGWSWGGMANVFAASEDNRISAIVSFDGTREPAFTKLISPQKITTPWLYISRTPDTIPQINKSGIDTSFSLLNEARYADVYQLTMYPMRHVDFISRHLRESSATDFGDYSKAEVARTYNVVAGYVLNFLDASLKNDQQALAFLHRTPAENNVPAHTMLAEIHQAQALPPSQASLAAELARSGFAHVAEAYQEARKRDTSFQLSQRDLKTWGYGLLDRGRALDAIEVMKLWTTLFPADWDAADSLAEAYQTAGNKPLAIHYYRKSLELNPGNANATKHLEVLSPGSTRESPTVAPTT